MEKMVSELSKRKFWGPNFNFQARRAFSGKARGPPGPKIESPSPARARLFRPDHIPTTGRNQRTGRLKPAGNLWAMAKYIYLIHVILTKCHVPTDPTFAQMRKANAG